MTPPESWPAGIDREQFVRITADAIHGTSTYCDSCRDRAEVAVDAIAPLIAKAVEEAEQGQEAAVALVAQADAEVANLSQRCAEAEVDANELACCVLNLWAVVERGLGGTNHEWRDAIVRDGRNALAAHEARKAGR